MNETIANKLTRLVSDICLAYKGTAGEQYTIPKTEKRLKEYLMSIATSDLVGTNEEQKENKDIIVKVYKGVEIDKNTGKKITYSRAKLPEYKHIGDSGADGYICFSDEIDASKDFYVVVSPGQVAKVPLGISCEIPEGYEIQVRPRSGESSEGHIAVFGTVDSPYRGVIYANIANLSPDALVLRQGCRICQLVVSPVTKANFTLVDGVINTETVRGSNGFGSTGK